MNVAPAALSPLVRRCGRVVFAPHRLWLPGPGRIGAGGCFLFEIIASWPELRAVLGGFVPKLEIVQNPKMLFLAIGILGATLIEI